MQIYATEGYTYYISMKFWSMTEIDADELQTFIEEALIAKYKEQDLSEFWIDSYDVENCNEDEDEDEEQ